MGPVEHIAGQRDRLIAEGLEDVQEDVLAVWYAFTGSRFNEGRGCQFFFASAETSPSITVLRLPVIQ